MILITLLFLVSSPRKVWSQLPDPPKTLEELRALARETGISNSLDDDICRNMAENGKCDTQPKIMLEFCQHACVYQIEKSSYFQTVRIDPDHNDLFFDLEAKTLDGKMLSFDSFDGFITVVINIGTTCSEEDKSSITDRIKKIRKTIPFNFQLVIFPHYLAKEDIRIDECATLQNVKEITWSNVHVMAPANLNGNSVHAVYKYLKELFKLSEIHQDKMLWFFIDHTGTRIDSMMDVGLQKVEKHIKEYILPWEEL